MRALHAYYACLSKPCILLPPTVTAYDPNVRFLGQLSLPITDTEDLSTAAGVGNRAGNPSVAKFF